MEATTKKIVTSALVIAGGVTMNQVEANATEEEKFGLLEDEIDQSDSELIEKALRQYTNPLRRISSEVETIYLDDYIKYEVQKGDTLSGISSKFDIPVSEIAQVNEITNPNKIREGQKLKIRLKEKTYVVKFGETLKDIANEKGVDLEELLSYNSQLKENNYTLYPGQHINIPTAPPEPVHQPVQAPARNQQATVASNTTEQSSQQAEQAQSQSFIWPMKGQITSPFGMRWGRMHYGLDIASTNANEPIVAAMGGIVKEAYYHRGGYGNLIIIDHGNGKKTYYAHLSTIAVSKGQKVAQGERIGNQGRTGNATGNHLHFEVRINNEPRNPINYLP